VRAQGCNSPALLDLEIRTDTQSTGKGGTVTIIAADSLLIVGRADTGEMITDDDSGITSGASAGSAGNAGNVMVEARELVVRGSDPRSIVGISSATASPSTGAAGTATISARNILLEKGSSVTVASEGSGRGGSLNITVVDTLQLDNATLAGRTKADVDVGDVKLEVGRLLHLRDSTVSTEGARGGNMLMQTPLLVLDKSKILSNTRPGEGGNIHIEAGQIIRTPDSRIEASGTITIAAPNTDVSSSLTVLPETFLNASSQLRVACATRGGRRASSLTPGGRGGLPPDPGTPLMATPSGQPLKQQTAATGSPTTSTTRPQQAAKPMTVSGIPQSVLGSPRLTCRGSRLASVAGPVQ
jgi:hypothetical protein